MHLVRGGRRNWFGGMPGLHGAPEQENPCMKKIEGTEKKYLQNTELSYIM